MGLDRRLLRQVGPYITESAQILAIDMAISPDVDPAGPVGVVLTDAELLLVASGSDSGHLTMVRTEHIRDVHLVQPDVVQVFVERQGRTSGEIVLDFRYFGVTDDTIVKLLALK
jgi:hypothetical protein